MKISASIYSNKQRSVEDLAMELDNCHIDYFHIDCNDDPSVFDDIGKIRKVSKTPIDLHVISNTPERYFDLILEHKVEFVSFQYENIKGKLNFPETNHTKFGLAIVSDTSIDAFADYADECEFVLIMTTTPGQSGGKFRPDNFRKIRDFRNSYPGVEIEVDGGVNDEVGFILRMMGVNSVVSGSYLVNHESIATALLHLKSSIIHSDFKVKDFAIPIENCPILKDGDYGMKDIIRQIEAYNLGFTFFTGQSGKFTGLSSNADVRHGMLKHLDDLNAIATEDIINRNPVTINENSTISELLDLIHSKKFLISFLPVVNDNHQLTGGLSFINLIRSES
ncbi:MAG: CBS domain-containing protein [Cyclobacteriaceae bacterium]